MSKDYFEEVSKVIHRISQSEIITARDLIYEYTKSNKKIFTCGNGGSAFAASHYITDWNKMYHIHTGKQFRGVSLCDNIGLITAYANDIEYAEVFSGQLSSLGEPGDLLIVISGSGNSQNLVSALERAKRLGIVTLAIVGFDGGICSELADYRVHIPSYDMQICEDVHLMFGHIVMKHLCDTKLVKCED